MTDPIADLVVRIKNAQAIRAEVVDIPHSKIKEEIGRILQIQGFIAKVEIMEKMKKKLIRLHLKYEAGRKGIIAGIKRISTPGRRIYSDRFSLPRVQAGFGSAIISTSKGLMTDGEARANKIGGEVLLQIW
jgi:small subunit ribosomal protein S8